MNAARAGRWVVALGVMTVAAGCASAEPAPPPELGTEFTLSGGDTAVLDAGRVTVLFRDVPEDSRCPAEVNCVREGDATVLTEVTVDGARSAHELHSNPQFSTEVRTGGYRIALRSMQPAGSSSEIPLPDYRVNLLVTRE
ncbi:hypothetical protein [Nocardia flavorosea]|uniref:Lipoprotein n=1 Tax=Nocardia flavorosea TaxID=53429 RepID=A0A846YI66_9NOCA|nr:hypothetical protein [Nocardia flavorosea]NKY57521.1 hypothetical protein [Nocardia flavorosea]